MNLHHGNLLDLSQLPGMPSYETLRLFLASRADFPVLRRGSSGVPHVFDLRAAAEFVRAEWRDQRRGAGAHQQLTLPITPSEERDQ